MVALPRHSLVWPSPFIFSCLDMIMGAVSLAAGCDTLKAGQQLLAIDRQALAGQSLVQAQEMLRAALAGPGSHVMLRIAAR